jgi:hypothetical protein
VSPVEGEEGGGRGAKSYDHENAWPSINYSILSDAAVHNGLPDNIITEAFMFFGKSFHIDPNNNEVKNWETRTNIFYRCTLFFPFSRSALIES